MRTPFLATVAALAALGLIRADDTKRDIDPYDQSGVAIEKQPDNDKLTKIVLIAGKASGSSGEHEYFAGCALLMKMLGQTKGVFPVMARDGWPKDSEKTFANAKAVFIYADGGDEHPVLYKGRQKAIDKLLAKKAGFVNMHAAVEYPINQGDHALKWLGGYYEMGFSHNPHWDAKFDKLPDHEIARGVRPFMLRDEWYFNMRFDTEAKKLTPILEATPPDNARVNAEAIKQRGRKETVAWAFEREDGGRSFGFTGGHHHKNWANDDFRRLVVNAILWSANVEIPKEGAPVKMDADDIKRNLDRKGKKK